VPVSHHKGTKSLHASPSCKRRKLSKKIHSKIKFRHPHKQLHRRRKQIHTYDVSAFHSLLKDN